MEVKKLKILILLEYINININRIYQRTQWFKFIFFQYESFYNKILLFIINQKKNIIGVSI